MARNAIAEQQQPTNIWTQAATSFECDGCGHHASFHKMDNRQDEEYERQWKSQQQARDGDQASQQTIRPSMAAGVESRASEQRQRQQRQIDGKEFEILDEELQIMEDDESAAPRASKKRRTTAR
ncbi:MAG: hypothetical protein LQ352_007362 [Teloschistes flavicans]|nr:MAG: hypothetical protein LQ352_007362 [Teloschistes flavicans]